MINETENIPFVPSELAALANRTDFFRKQNFLALDLRIALFELGLAARRAELVLIQQIGRPVLEESGHSAISEQRTGGEGM